MFANLQANRVPITPRQLLERPLEPQIAYSIDPPDTIEVDDAVSVSYEKSRYGDLTTHINTYIAETALLGMDSDVFNNAHERVFTVYNGSKTEYLMPPDVIEQLSLGNNNEIGSPAIALRTRIHHGNVALTGIDRVRVRVNALSYGQFDRQSRPSGDPEVKDILQASRILVGLGYYSTHHTHLSAHDVVASHMVMANTQLAHYALINGLPWIYRSHRGKSALKTGKSNGLAHYTHRPRLHQGLGGVVYCHGTSPLRRFPDQVDQLVLVAHMEGNEPPVSVQETQAYSIDSNTRMRQLLGRQSILAA